MKQSMGGPLTAGLAALMLMLMLAGCGSDSPPPSTEPDPAPPASSQPEAPTPAVQSGRILAMGDPALERFTADCTAGTQQELDRWHGSIDASGKIAALDVCRMHEAEAPLPADQISGVIKLLMGADLALYEALGNPPTGGSTKIIAYDADGAPLFHAMYNGEWFWVLFGEEDLAYVFNGEGSSLDQLTEHIPE